MDVTEATARELRLERLADDLERVQRECPGLADSAGQMLNRVRQGFTPEVWSGPAAERAFAGLQAVSAQAMWARQEIDQVGEVAWCAASVAREVAEALRRAVTAANQSGAPVVDDAVAAWPAGKRVPLLDPVPSPRAEVPPPPGTATLGLRPPFAARAARERGPDGQHDHHERRGPAAHERSLRAAGLDSAATTGGRGTDVAQDAGARAKKVISRSEGGQHRDVGHLKEWSRRHRREARRPPTVRTTRPSRALLRAVVVPEGHDRPGLGGSHDGADREGAGQAVVGCPAMRIPVRRLDPTLPLPVAAHEGDAGYDLRAREAVILAPGGGRAAVSTGIAVAIPPGWAGLVLPRSGLALRHGVTCLNAPGLIDAGFRDEIRVILVNHDPADAFKIEVGDRIAQLVIQAVEAVEWAEVDDLGESARGRGGFGSTGRQ